ncbi:class I SAM-dependent methyltransferase [Candidatus Uabimicrobium sp. HlEnr_7]|uniref:class I SAM-dependent methyltransferase n=1 Tax=Candidatus Uabimicrobium helgolandensis TaxID=3095367 RepID=UPI0035576090
MMPNLSQIYDDSFFNEWGCYNESYVASSQVVANILLEQLQFKSLVDIGCGCGTYSHFYQQKGIEVLSLDGVQPAYKNCFPIKITLRDFTVPFENTWGDFDVALCLEVAEHIEEKFLPQFLENITQFSNTLILSAADPFQGGHHHVNEQPKRYWKKKLQEIGFAYNRKRTGQFLEKFKKVKAPHMWMGNNVSVYEKIE